MVSESEKKVIIFDGQVGEDGNIEVSILPSLDDITRYIEFDSCSGDEIVFTEDGEILHIFVNFGRTYRGILGNIVNVPDFKYIDYSKSGDFSKKEYFKDLIIKYLGARKIILPVSESFESAISHLLAEIGVVKC